MKQQRNTKQRQLVLDAVRARKDHPSADEIYLDVRKIDNKISRGTVYRNLNILNQNGEINHIKVPSAYRFDWRLDFHYHLICTECEKVIDLPEMYQQEKDKAMADQTGYIINRHRTIFEGICPDCQRREREDVQTLD